jgi:hypothetical protein
LPARSTGPRQLVGPAIATRYVATLLERPNIVHFLQQNHPEILTVLPTILTATSMQDPQKKRTEADRRAPHVDPDRPKTAPDFAQGRGRNAPLRGSSIRAHHGSNTSTVSNTSTKAYPRPSSRLRLSHDRAERDRPAYPPQSHAGDPDHRRGAPRLDAGTLK